MVLEKKILDKQEEKKRENNFIRGWIHGKFPNRIRRGFIASCVFKNVWIVFVFRDESALRIYSLRKTRGSLIDV